MVGEWWWILGMHSTPTLWIRVLPEKLRVLQLVKKLPIFYGTWRFMTVFTGAHCLPPVLIQINPVHTPSICFSNIHINILSMPRSPKWSLFRFPHKNSVTYFFSSICATCPAYIILDMITEIIFGEEQHTGPQKCLSVLGTHFGI